MRLLLIVLGVLAVLLVAARIAAPLVAERVIDDVLATMPSYDAQIRDVDLSVLGGWVALDDLELRRAGGAVPEPFVALHRLTVTPRLRSWLGGRRVVDLDLDGLAIAYVLGPNAATTQTEVDPEWLRAVLSRFPVAPDHVTVTGSFRYLDRSASPDVDVEVPYLDVDARNLANLEADPEPLFGRIDVRGRVEQSGALTAHAVVDPFASHPRFELDASVEGLALPEVNDALRAYGRFDVDSGAFSVESRLDARDGAYVGTATPEIDHLQVTSLREATHGNVGHSLWEVLVGAAGKVGQLVSPGKGEIDLQVPVRGTFSGGPPLLEVLRILPSAWFGSLTRAVSVGSGAANEAAKGAVEAGKAAEPERARPKKKAPR